MPTKLLRRLARRFVRATPVALVHLVERDVVAGPDADAAVRAADHARDRERARQEGTWLDYGSRT